MSQQKNQHKGFNFERHLPHQDNAVNAVLGVLGNATLSYKDQTLKDVQNPILDIPFNLYKDSLVHIQTGNQIETGSRVYRNNGNILDISMETGTGKTYAYTRTMFELNRQLGIFKFIVVVPTVSIRAGTMNFLKSEASKDHFKQEFGKEIKPFVLESQKTGKNKKTVMPLAISEFVRSQENGQYIYVLVVNGGMLNSDKTMDRQYDHNIFDRYNVPFEALASVQPITIIDEPHRFKKENTTWEKIKKLHSQYIIRYGATFNKQYENLLYNLTAVDAFNQDLVKGITTYIEEFEEGRNISVKLTETTSQEATFELNNNDRTSTFKLTKGESMTQIHPEMIDLWIESLNRSQVILSNGLELSKGSKINPYSYSESLQDRMINKAIQNHFKLEKDFLTRDVKIKPLTLFFIDDIEGYRNANDISGSLKTKVENLIIANAKKLLETETNAFYKAYLQKTVKDVSLTHGGYFSKDNGESDDKIAKEVEEILYDKESLLSLDNPRRFIFSKWTLREGWDNPNVFQICKLRSSGSETSKLQEVGRGLRLPVNEYMSRVKDENFYLNYYVDFTEKDFAEALVAEINEKSGAFTQETINKVNEVVINRILKAYPEYDSDEQIYEFLFEKGAIKMNHEFKDGGFAIFKDLFGRIFDLGLKTGKVSNNNSRPKVSIRTGKYNELKALWEKINEKVILEYKFKDEKEFEDLLNSYFKNNKEKFKPQGVNTRIEKIVRKDNQVGLQEIISEQEDILPLSMMKYSEFLLELSQRLKVNRNTLHKIFSNLQCEININDYLSQQTIRVIRNGFTRYLLDNAISKFEIGYKKVNNRIHPTAFTDAAGNPLTEIDSANVGILKDDEIPSSNYYFEEIFYDSALELENIKKDISSVVVYTKIPKSTIRIPVAGGGTYSPDFAYVVNRSDGKQQLNLIIETKGKEDIDLAKVEDQKINHATEMFRELNKNSEIEVKFARQLKGQQIANIISQNL